MPPMLPEPKSWRRGAVRVRDSNHATPLLQGLEGGDLRGSSVVRDCQVGEIREGFLEEVMLEPRFLSQAGINQVQRREKSPILLIRLIR